MEEATVFVATVDRILISARALLKKAGISVEGISSVAYTVAKIAYLVKVSPSATAFAPTMVPVLTISSDTPAVTSPPVAVPPTTAVASSITAPATDDDVETDSADWAQ